MTALLNISKSTLERDIRVLKEANILEYKGSSKAGTWICKCQK